MSSESIGIIQCDCEHNTHKAPCILNARVRVPTAYNTYYLCLDCFEHNHIPKEYQESLPTIL